MSAPLLLHSLAELRELVLQCFQIARVRSVVEIGAESGTFTRELASWVAARGGSLTSIDPAPSEELRAAAGTLPSLRLVERRSPEALDEVAPADAYLVDGDHNHFTVSGELAAVDRACFAAGQDALVVLHDVAWPCARRDLYYAPALLPAGAVHPHAFDRGVAPGEPGTVAGGFRGEGVFAVALTEGGPRNGVLTAVEDFLAGREDLAFARVPLVFGLGFLWPRRAAWSSALSSMLAPWVESPILARVEENRIALYLSVLAAQDRAAEQERRLAEARGARDAAEQALREAHDELGRLRVRLADLEASALHRTVEAIRGAKERLAPPGTARRRALDAAVVAAKDAVARAP